MTEAVRFGGHPVQNSGQARLRCAVSSLPLSLKHRSWGCQHPYSGEEGGSYCLEIPALSATRDRPTPITERGARQSGQQTPPNQPLADQRSNDTDGFTSFVRPTGGSSLQPRTPVCLAALPPWALTRVLPASFRDARSSCWGAFSRLSIEHE